MTYVGLVEAILKVLGLVGVGVLLRLTGLLKSSDAKTLNTVIIYVGLPAFIFRTVHPAALGPDLAIVAGVAWLVILAGGLAAWLIGRGMRLPKPALGAFILVAALGNTGYIGYSVSQGLLGSEGLVRAVFFDVFGTVGALLLIGLPIAEKTGTSDARVHVLRELLTFPAVIALAVALATRSVPVPDLVSGWLDALGSLVVPLIMISVGLSLRFAAVRKYAVPIAAVTVLKMVALPLLAGVIGHAAGQPADVNRLLVLEAGMPSMMLSLAIGMRFGLDTDLIASAIFVTTVVSALTVPLLQLPFM